MITFEITVLGEVQLHRAISRFAAGVSDLRPAWPDVRAMFYAIEAEQFHTEGGAGASGPWAPLSPAYAAWKGAHGGNKGTLVRTGALMASLTGGLGGVMSEAPLSLSVGSSVGYGLFHQLGTRRMPQRKVIDLSDRNKRRLMRVIQGYLVKLGESSAAAAA